MILIRVKAKTPDKHELDLNLAFTQLVSLQFCPDSLLLLFILMHMGDFQYRSNKGLHSPYAGFHVVARVFRRGREILQTVEAASSLDLGDIRTVKIRFQTNLSIKFIVRDE